jgi:hypothetical protein
MSVFYIDFIYTRNNAIGRISYIELEDFFFFILQV